MDVVHGFYELNRIFSVYICHKLLNEKDEYYLISAKSTRYGKLKSTCDAVFRPLELH